MTPAALPLRAAVLVSGGGTNLQALLDARDAGTLGADVVLVVSNKPGVGALDRAAKHGVPAEVISHRDFASREAFDAALVTALRARDVGLVVLAGFMRIVTPVLLDAFPGRVINVHPALLPSFPGVDAQAQALAYGVRVTGATVHFVDAGVDTGPILAQAPVPVLDDDTVETLRARILREEHRLLVGAVHAVATGRARVEGRRVRFA
jgi:phosphoribosylglycinamide formyltransferase-1